MIQEGDGEGEHLVPIEHTSKPVDLDLVVDTLRLPFRQRLEDHHQRARHRPGRPGRRRYARSIRNADPALKEPDKVVQLLAGQNRVLADLAATPTRCSRPWPATARASRGSSRTARRPPRRPPSAARRWRRRSGACRRSCASCARPWTASAGWPTSHAGARDVGAVAPDINRFVTRLGAVLARVAARVPHAGGRRRPRPAGAPAVRAVLQDARDFTITGQPLGLDLRT